MEEDVSVAVSTWDPAASIAATPMRLAVGVLAPHAGEVAVAGQVTRRGTRGLGYPPQDCSAVRGVRVDEGSDRSGEEVERAFLTVIGGGSR